MNLIVFAFLAYLQRQKLFLMLVFLLEKGKAPAGEGYIYISIQTSDVLSKSIYKTPQPLVSANWDENLMTASFSVTFLRCLLISRTEVPYKPLDCCAEFCPLFESWGTPDLRELLQQHNHTFHSAGNGFLLQEDVACYFQSLSPFPFFYIKKEQKALKYFLCSSGL